MNRRLFCQFPLVASALLAQASPSREPHEGTPPRELRESTPSREPGESTPPRESRQPGESTPPGQSAKGIKVESHRDRFNEELLIMGGQFDCKVSSKDTGGELCIYDTFRHEKGGPALHMHYQQDEWFFVMQGEFVIKVGDDLFHLKAGDSAFAPRKVPHTFAMVSEGEGRMLVLLQPAGSIEEFFKAMSKFGPSIPKGKEQALKTLFHTHAMELLGPPLHV